MAQFVWITENYRVNLDAIFSLERRYIDDYDQLNVWNIQYDQLFSDITQNGIDNEDLKIDVSDGHTITDEEYTKIYDYIISIIGDSPLTYRIEYHIILSTGVTMQIAEDKFNKISEVIDSIR